MLTMSPKKKSDAGETRPDVALGLKIDPEIREALDAFIAAYNDEHDHPATVRSVVEAALRHYFSSEGYWPPKPKK